MHRVLHIQELLAIIFSYIQSPKSLAALARTCQAWSDLALDILWEKHGKLTHLVRFLPSGMRTKTGLSKRTFNEFSLRGDVIPSDWGKFKKYHHRIRNVIAPAMYLGIWSCLRAKPPRDVILFPRIRSLTCTCKNAKEVMVLQLFLGPSLRNLVFNIQYDSQLPHIQSMCAKVLRTCPHLTSIHCSFPIHKLLLQKLPKLSNILGDFICQYPALEDLSVPHLALSTDTIRHIIRLPRLHTLTWSPESSYPTDEDDLGFPSLVYYRHLKSQGPALDSINSFLSTMTLLHPNTKIRTLCVTDLNQMTETQINKALSLIANRCDQSTLTALELVGRHPFLPESDPDRRIELHFDTLRPLLKFRNIQRLLLSRDGKSGCVFDDIDDDMLQVMSSAWPHLTHFGLDVAGFKITLDGFLAFLKGSPDLELVKLTADFDPISLKCTVDELPRYPKMKILNAEDSILNDDSRTSDLFLRLFPELISVGCNSDSPYFWRDVDSVISRQWELKYPCADRYSFLEMVRNESSLL